VQTVDFPLTGGVDQATNAKLLQSPRLVQAKNLRIVDSKFVRQRRGTALLASGAVDAGSPTPIGPVRLANHNGQVIVASEESLWTVGASGARLEELDMLPVTTLQGVTSLGHYGSANVVACACAETTAFRVHTWSTYDGTDYALHIQTVDLARGAGTAATVVPLSSASQGLKCLKAIAIGSKVTVFWGEGTQELKYLDITSATQGPYTSAQGTLLASDVVMTAPQWFDVSPHSTGYVLVYRNIAGASYKVKRFNSSHVEQASGTFTPTLGSAPIFGIAGWSAGGTIAVVYGNTDASPTDAATVVWYNDSIVQTNTRTFTPSVWRVGVVRSIAVSALTGGAAGDIAIAADGAGRSVIWSLDESNTGNDGVTLRLWDATVASKPWAHQNDVFVLMRYRTSAANSYVAVVRATTWLSTRASATPILEARFRSGQATDAALDDSASSVIYTAGQVYACVTSNDRPSNPAKLVDPTGETDISDTAVGAIGNQTLTVVGVDSFCFELSGRDRWQAATVGQYTCFSGGVITAFDGRRALEIGWSSYPELEDSGITTSNSTGTVAAGTYQFGACWEQTDYLGNRSQSAVKLVRDQVMTAPSDTFTIANVKRISLTGRSWKIGGDDGRVINLALYRSTVGTIKLNRLEGPGAALFPVSAVNSTSSVVPSYTDGNLDATITLSSRELVYTTDLGSNELQNEMPPPSNVICGHENRLFFVCADKPSEVGYTKQQFPGTALAWNQSLLIPFDADVHALASQDGNLIGFCADAIYTVAGRPADNTGRSTGYDPPILLSGHLGTTDRRSVVASPVGVWFRSKRGLEVLPRGGGAPIWLGERVRSSLESFPIITAALHNPAASEVLFSCVTAETVGATGVVLAYDYSADVWFVRSYQDKPISDMTIDGGMVVFGVYDSAAALSLWKEDTGFDDAGGQFVGWTLETGDIRAAKAMGLQSLWRATLLGECEGRVLLTVEESVDGSAYMGHTYKVTASDELEIQYETRQRKGRKHRLRLTQTTAGVADTEGVALAALTLEIAALEGSARTASPLRG
jgi:hypothetical protein